MTFQGGVLPSGYPEAQGLPNVQTFLAEQMDMQFADLRVLLRLPQPSLAPSIGANFTTAAMILNLISGFSIWFFHNRSAKRIENKERQNRAKMPYSGQRFTAFVRSYYPRAVGEPTVTTVANVLYDTRNILSRSLGIGEVKRLRAHRNMAIVKPDPALSEQDVVLLETEAVFALQGVPVQRKGQHITLYVPGLYWALGKMLRSALGDQPQRCDAYVEPAVGAFPKGATSP